jgi:hypothetical protein
VLCLSMIWTALSMRRIQSSLETAARWAARLRSEDESANALASIIDQAVIAEDGIRLSIRMPLQEIYHRMRRVRFSLLSDTCPYT